MEVFMEKIRTLIADDQKELMTYLLSILKNKEEIEIIGSAENGQEEFDKIIELEPDIVFTDNQMPKLNGLDVIDLVRKSNIKKQPEFVLITGDRDYTIINRAYSLNVLGVVNKPYTEDKIFQIIDDYIFSKDNNNDKIENINNKVENKSFLSKILNKLRK
jgi:two-component system response regulator (stage 0 sporulation protein A)